MSFSPLKEDYPIFYARRECISLIRKSLKDLYNIDIDANKVSIGYPPNKEYGDLSSNIILRISKELKEKPDVLSSRVVEYINSINTYFEKIGSLSGYINFRYSSKYYEDALNIVFKYGDKYGSWDEGKGAKVIVE
ncbi:MAG: hypothetical protein QXL15_01975, partial [Candidatus Korarchaeota archaeon]